MYTDIPPVATPLLILTSVKAGGTNYDFLYTARNRRNVRCFTSRTCLQWKRAVFHGCWQGMSNVFAAPPIKYFVIFFRLSIPNPNPEP